MTTKALDPRYRSFDSDRWHEVWRSLPRRTQEAIKAKATWEHMSLSAVTLEWWPKIWKRVMP